MKPIQLAKPVLAEVPPTLSADDLRSAAMALDDLWEDVIPNTLRAAERSALMEVAAWLRQAAKVVEPRDVLSWDAIQAMREDRETRGANQLLAGRYGVGEATAREASMSRRIDRSKRRIVR